jgi:16S rRNA processing protein RimM
MTQTNKHFVPIGKIGTTYGIQGWLKIQTYTEFDINILNYQPWYLSHGNDHWNISEIVVGRKHGKGIIIKFPTIHTPEEARLLTGKIIAIPRSQLPTLKQGEYYWTDLEGLSVINQHGEYLGKIIYLMETGSHDVMVIKGSKEMAIPYLLGKVITNIDLIAQKIHVNWEYI